MPPFTFACPQCHALLDTSTPNLWRCPAGHGPYPLEDGIWRCLTPAQSSYYAQFVQEYETVRRAEGWGSPSAAYYRALPYPGRDDPHAAIWHIRARSYQTLQRRLLAGRPPQRILDLGAGNGWLSHRLAQAGHHLLAIDLLVNPVDGLGAHHHYPPPPFLPIQASFNQLPLAAGQADLVIYNGSIHYATDYEQTLREARRLLAPAGTIVIMDSPCYSQPDSGAQMVRERQARFQQAFGFAANALPNENFLTPGRVATLAAELGLTWRIYKPFYGWRWALRPWLARLAGHRQPAQFYLLAARANP